MPTMNKNRFCVYINETITKLQKKNLTNTYREDTIQTSLQQKVDVYTICQDLKRTERYEGVKKLRREN